MRSFIHLPRRAKIPTSDVDNFTYIVISCRARMKLSTRRKWNNSKLCEVFRRVETEKKNKKILKLSVISPVGVAHIFADFLSKLSQFHWVERKGIRRYIKPPPLWFFFTLLSTNPFALRDIVKIQAFLLPFSYPVSSRL